MSGDICPLCGVKSGFPHVPISSFRNGSSEKREIHFHQTNTEQIKRMFEKGMTIAEIAKEIELPEASIRLIKKHRIDSEE